MSRKTKEEALKTRTRILASALALFAKKGYEKTTFTDVAARLKMTKGAVYWHFASKEALLLALVDEMLAKFKARLAELLPEGETTFEKLSFPSVADMMIRHAAQVLGDPKGRAFFLLMHEQIRWSSATMDDVRENLMHDNRWGPWEAFRTAVANDIRDGRARSDVDPAQIASCCLALWNGLVHAQIAKVLHCDLIDTLTNAYAAIWRDVSKESL